MLVQSEASPSLAAPRSPTNIPSRPEKFRARTHSLVLQRLVETEATAWGGQTRTPPLRRRPRRQALQEDAQAH